MTTETVQLFSAMLALVALACAVGLLATRVVARRAVNGTAVLASAATYRNHLSALIAGTAMAGSLYFSEVADYVPCTLCWYQRIAMYPLAIICTIAAVRGDSVRPYVATLSGLGAVIAMYHWLLERIPELDSGACSVSVPCDLVWFEQFGFVTLPFMAFCGFFAIFVLSTLRGDS